MTPELPPPETDTQPRREVVAAAGDMLRLSAAREHFNTALRMIAEVTGAAGARIWWRVRSEFPIAHWATLNAGLPEVTPETTGSWAAIWEDNERTLKLSPETLPPGVVPQDAGAVTAEAWALIPSGTSARGAVVFWWTSQPDELSNADRRLLREALSAYTAQVWWRERWAQRKLERELLDETGQILARSFAREDVLGRIFGLLRRVVHFDAGGIFLIHPKEGEIAQIVQTGYDQSAIDNLHLKIGQGLVGYAAKSGETIIVPDVTQDERYVNARPATRSTLVVPIQVRDHMLGVLNLESDSLTHFDPNDEWLVQSFADQVAIALDRAELYDQQIEVQRLNEQISVARSIQQSFLPQKPPLLEGYDIAGANFPSEEVGGDYFDFVPIVEGQWGIAIADVSGKGIPAALLMAGFRASLIAEIRNNYAIRTIFRKVNNVLREMTSRDNFITGCYGVLDSRNRVFTFSNAGHNPPILLRASGEVERLAEGGPLIGVIQDAKYQERPIWLGNGDLLMLFTDGVTESMRADGEEFGEERLIDLMRSTRELPASEIVQRIHNEVSEFAGERKRLDDVTLIAVKML
jgi:sigma-B regulation protein RsbU (phosphoserine phosphatase)